MEVNLISTFAEFKELKNIDRPTLMSVLEDIFRTQLARMYGDADNFDIIINIDKGDISIIRNRMVVETVEDPNKEISLEEVQKIDDSYEIGEEYPEEVPMSSFGRRGILNLRQNLSSRITDIEKGNLYKKYVDKVGDILVGEVYQAWKKEVLVMDEDGNELVLPKSEQIPSDFFRKGDTVKAVILSVEMRNNSPVITLSRTSNLFLERLFEQEVPEIFDGLITIKKVVRMPGERAKVAVESYDERIDPVGACVGVKGSRIHGIVRELRNENIDIINWTTNTQLLRFRRPRSRRSASTKRARASTSTWKPANWLWPSVVAAATSCWPNSSRATRSTSTAWATSSRKTKKTCCSTTSPTKSTTGSSSPSRRSAATRPRACSPFRPRR